MARGLRDKKVWEPLVYTEKGQKFIQLRKRYILPDGNNQTEDDVMDVVFATFDLSLPDTGRGKGPIW